MNQTINVIQNLSTTRREQFGCRKIDDEKIELIKNAILKTANASNRQSYSVIVLDREKAAELSLPGDRVFVFCLDFNRLKKCAEKLGCTFDTQYLMQYSTALIDLSLLVQSAVIAAQSLEIDTLITNEIYHNRIDKTFELLKLPEKYVFPMIALCMGYSQEDKKAKGRLDKEYIFFDNEYGQFTEEQLSGIIRQTDDEKCRISLTDSWKELGFGHYLEWFFEKWSNSIGNRNQNDIFESKLRDHEII